MTNEQLSQFLEAGAIKLGNLEDSHAEADAATLQRAAVILRGMGEIDEEGAFDAAVEEIRGGRRQERRVTVIYTRAKGGGAGTADVEAQDESGTQVVFVVDSRWVPRAGQKLHVIFTWKET